VTAKAFKTKNKALRAAKGMVGIDAYANDAAQLTRSLKALGATKVKARGPGAQLVRECLQRGQLLREVERQAGDASFPQFWRDSKLLDDRPRGARGDRPLTRDVGSATMEPGLGRVCL
jgi:hypothetical protein